jgi:2-hydroxychromene-2-carboxylate isomerase
VEPESVDLARLPAFLRAAAGTVQAPEFASHVRRCHARMVAAGRSLDLQPQDFDQLVFGQALSTRVVDPRIGTVLERIITESGADAAAAFADVASGRTLAVVRDEHTKFVKSHSVWGTPTFIVDDKAVFVRLLDHAHGDQQQASKAINRILDDIDWPILNELKHTSIPM